MKYIFSCVLYLILLLFNIPHAQAHSLKVIVRMSAAGFIPANVTADENQSVVFINEDKEDHWPASDIHPTHELYPEFDPQKSITPGQKWEFTPQKVGSWKFHDHLFPHFRGLVNVINEAEFSRQSSPSTSFLSTAKDSISLLHRIWLWFTHLFSQFIARWILLWSFPKTISSSHPDAQKFKQISEKEQLVILDNLIKQSGSQSTWSYLLNSFSGESGTKGNVHDLAHFIGSLIFKKDGFPGLVICTPQFAFGCYHGFLDSAFKESLEQLPQAEQACQKLGTGISGPVSSCIHGIGHGVASFYQTSDLTRALTVCQRLSLPAQTYCHDGVFMEFAHNAPVSFFKSAKPLYPCDEIAEIYHFTCGRNLPFILRQRYAYSYTKIVTVCLEQMDTNLKNGCVDALGFTAVASASGDTKSILDMCALIVDTTYNFRCVQAAAGELVFQEFPGWQTDALILCKSLTLEYQNQCQTYVQNIITVYGRFQTFQFRSYRKNEDKSLYVREQMAICYQQGGRDSCYKQTADLFSRQFPLKETLALFAQTEAYPEIYTRCHEVTHYLSRNEFTKNQSVPETYSQCNSTCHGGCYHGVLEAYLKSKQVALDSPQFNQEFKTVCGQISDYTKPLLFYECLHGLGHAAMFVTDMELPQSLALCDLLPDSANQPRCYSGIFMENSSSSTSTDHPGKYVKKSDLLYPCSILESKYLATCYRYQSSYFSLLTNHNWVEVARLCQTAPVAYQDECIRTIGTNQVGFTQDFMQMKANCQNLTTYDFRRLCFDGVISSLAYRYVGDVQKMVDFCGLVPNESQESCFHQIGSALTDWTSHRDEASHWCEQIQNLKQQAWCKQSIT